MKGNIDGIYAAPICMWCKHLKIGEGLTKITCSAYPEGIPENILHGVSLHQEPEAGDGGVVFSLMKGEKLPAYIERRLSSPVN